MKLDFKKLRNIALKATQGPWGPWTSNYPFYVDVRKPSPSLSKHDEDQPTYWNMNDAAFVLAFNPECVLELLYRVEGLEESVESKKTLTREMDEILSGKEGMAKQASLCDLIHPLLALKNNYDKALETLEKIGSDKDLDAVYIARNTLEQIKGD